MTSRVRRGVSVEGSVGKDNSKEGKVKIKNRLKTRSGRWKRRRRRQRKTIGLSKSRHI